MTAFHIPCVCHGYSVYDFFPRWIVLATLIISIDFIVFKLKIIGYSNRNNFQIFFLKIFDRNLTLHKKFFLTGLTGFNRGPKLF